ncbi:MULTISPECIES: MFS transporter [Burkholderia]|uniref:MFS transporter n=1 Tax=Burkholderia TaxID=32008 RepID=UPI0009E91F14|nr:MULTISPECIES: MFS transporter [Burkholderia]
MQAPPAAPAARSIRAADSPAAPATLPRSAVALFACASGLSVANVYYAQPLLDALAADFAIGRAAIGGVVTATQIGCALALLLLVPLGDLVDRRRLMLAQSLALAATLTVVGFAPTATVLLAGMLGAGLLGTAMTQGLISYAASAAAAHERGRVVGAAQGGVVVGLLLARVLAGVVSEAAGWRSVYFLSAATMLVLAALLARKLPAVAPAPSRIGYPRLIASLFTLLRDERVLQIRGTIALLMFAAFNIFWNALVLPLSAPPYAFSHTAIGAFGLVGALGALAAARAGHWADRGFGQPTSAAALALLLASWLPIAFMPASLWALALGVVLLDVGGQAIHVTNQSMIFRARPDAHSRLVAVYMLFYSVGSGLGAIASTAVYAAAGWRGVCMLGAATSAAAFAFWAATARLMPSEPSPENTANGRPQ